MGRDVGGDAVVVIDILFVMDDFPDGLGGTERQVMETLRRLDRSRFRPHLACLAPVESRCVTESPCPVVPLDLPRLRSPLLLGAAVKFACYVRRHDIRIVQSFFGGATLVTPVLGRLSGVPVVVASRRNIGYWHTAGEVARLRSLRRFTTHYVANSTAAAAVCRRRERVGGRLVSVIPNGIDVEAYVARDPSLARRRRAAWGFPEGSFVIGAVGNLRDVKDHASFVRAAAQLHGEWPATRFVVLGEGPLRGALTEAIEAAGLTGKFALPGSTTDVPGALAAFDVAVLCSRSESLSNAVLEYMAAGLPIVASRVGGIEEAITDGATGLLYDADDPLPFVGALRALCADAALRTRLGTAAAAVVRDRFSWPAVMQRTEALYASLDATARMRRRRIG